MSNNLSSFEILEKLISFPTISRSPNIELIKWVSNLLTSFGVKTTILQNEDGSRANLYATTGAEEHGGIMLSGHTDVVPTEGQDWQTDPFKLTKLDGKLFGRGTADMKGFCASAIKYFVMLQIKNLKPPYI